MFHRSLHFLSSTTLIVDKPLLPADNIPLSNTMDTYPDVTPLWDLPHNQDFANLADSDFLALLQKQFPSPNGAPLGFMGAYPDPLSIQNGPYSLPSLTPPSEDSSPSPPNSNNQDPPSEDNPEPAAPKRKASDDDLSEGPSQKAQHTDREKRAPTSTNANASSRRKSSGATGKDETRLLKRKEQNRAAQRAFRERKEKHVKDLEDKVADLEAQNEASQHENENLRDLLLRLQSENVALKQSTFTFSVPKNAAATPNSSLFSVAPSPQSAAPSSVANHSSPKMSNPLDWSSLTTFDPAMLNLLDDNPQPTATEGAMHMDFGFGGTGLASNAPYTTIASNPMFMSFASTFDHLSPQTDASGSTPGSTSFTNGNSAFNFDINSLSSWPTPSSNSQEATLDDLFAGYMTANGALDFPVLSQSPSSISPVTHHTTPSSLLHSSSASSTSSPSALGSSDPLNKGAHGEGKCPKTKAECEKHIAAEGESPFAPTNNVRKSSDGASGSIVACSGSSFPKTTKSDRNIEVLNVGSSTYPSLSCQDADINELCSEFTSKARCDGTKVVLEPEGVNSILEALSKKQ
ncbi:unnamed protein product [Cyclocybe aegerita]|uniref:BZIP domain-containing protein n=1 Tax=Cyclocybe aegerita TaxID=1973307 RepID=A0A8S0WSR5_CYCAE|nr:unnamed protein product [Cyclocybe aegerita]